MSSDLSHLLASTFLGGNFDDSAQAIAIDKNGNVYVAGYTYSSNFPIKNGLQYTFSGASDAFIVKLADTYTSSSDHTENIITKYHGECIIVNLTGEKLRSGYKLIFVPSNTYKHGLGYFIGLLIFSIEDISNLQSLSSIHNPVYISYSPFFLGLYISLMKAYIHDKKKLSGEDALKKIYDFMTDNNHITIVPIKLPLTQKYKNYICFIPMYLNGSDIEFDTDTVTTSNEIWLVDKAFFDGIIMLEGGALFSNADFYLEPLTEKLMVDEFFNKIIRPKYEDILKDIGISIINNDYISMLYHFYQEYSAVIYYYKKSSTFMSIYNMNYSIIEECLSNLTKDCDFLTYNREVYNYLHELLVAPKSYTKVNLLLSIIRLSDSFDKLYEKSCKLFTGDLTINSENYSCSLDDYLILTNPFENLFSFFVNYISLDINRNSNFIRKVKNNILKKLKNIDIDDLVTINL